MLEDFGIAENRLAAIFLSAMIFLMLGKKRARTQITATARATGPTEKASREMA